MRPPAPDGDGCDNVTGQFIPGEIEAFPPCSSLVVSYAVQVDVLDSQYNQIALRSKHKRFEIRFNRLDAVSDLEEVTDGLIQRYEVFREAVAHQRAQPPARPRPAPGHNDRALRRGCAAVGRIGGRAERIRAGARERNAAGGC
jgi:hypothetical protein